MANVSLGRVGYVHRGAYLSGTTYQKYDVVLYNHGSYVYVNDTAAAGKAPTDTAYWQALLNPEEMNAATEAAVNAAEGARRAAQEMAGQMDKLTTPFEERGALVSCRPVLDYPLSVISFIEPMQSGSGEPAPSNIRPLSGWTGARLARAGKNLVDEVPAYVLDGCFEYSFLTPLPAGIYTLTAAITTNDTDAAYSLVRFGFGDGIPAQYLYFRKRNGEIETQTITLNLPCKSMRICASESIANSAGDTLTVEKLQLEFAAAASAYAPYQGDQYAAAFGQTVYGGALDWKTGALTVTHRLLTLTGNEEWSMNKTGVFGCGIGSSAAVQSSQTDAEAFRGACSHYKSGLTFAQIWNTAEQAASVAVSGGVTYCRIHDGNHAAAADFKAYLAAQYAAGTPVQIAYPLAAETKIDLPPQMVLALAGENSLWSDCGETEVQGALSPAWRDQQQDRRIAALEAALLNECVGDGEGRFING